MTAYLSTRLFCNYETRPRVDGMRTECGTEFGPYALGVPEVRALARAACWATAGVRDFCPTHAFAAAVAAAA